MSSRPDYLGEDLFWGPDQPTTKQRFWGQIFLGLFNLVSDHGRGVGKTFFWKKVIAYIQSQEPYA